VTRVNLLKRNSKGNGTISGITFYYIPVVTRSASQPKDVHTAQRFTRDQFEWIVVPVQRIDQRHAVGLTRFCRFLNDRYRMCALYTQGVNGDSIPSPNRPELAIRTDCHGWGYALDFGGSSTESPVPSKAKARSGDDYRVSTVRLGIDFFVDFHWGNWDAIPMWDPKTIVEHPSDSTQWKRSNQATDDRIDYTTDPPGKTKKLHYRLDPPPFQDPVPALADPALQAELSKAAPHFHQASALFRAIYEFATREYSDNNDDLGPLPSGKIDAATPLDAQAGARVMHADYPKPSTLVMNKKTGKLVPGPNGREAHCNHIHMQLGPTQHGKARET
jgi:hypothetical protein